MAAQHLDPKLTAHLKSRYSSYYHTIDNDAKEQFLSPSCNQICRTSPGFAARNRDTIMGYIKEAASKANHGDSRKSYYTIRPLDESEFDFGTAELVQPAGFASTSEVEQKARNEGWVGIRVDICEETIGEENTGFLVKVQYWWRKESSEWVQIFHDIMYMGPFDGTQGTEGELQS